MLIINCPEFIFLWKLFAVRFPYKHSKFEADLSIYPECNAWRLFFCLSRIVITIWSIYWSSQNLKQLPVAGAKHGKTSDWLKNGRSFLSQSLKRCNAKGKKKTWIAFDTQWKIALNSIAYSIYVTRRNVALNKTFKMVTQFSTIWLYKLLKAGNHKMHRKQLSTSSCLISFYRDTP